MTEDEIMALHARVRVKYFNYFNGQREVFELEPMGIWEIVQDQHLNMSGLFSEDPDENDPPEILAKAFYRKFCMEEVDEVEVQIVKQAKKRGS